MIIPPTQKALFLTGVKEELIIREIDNYIPNAGELLVRIESIALNPVDWIIQESGWGVKEFPFIAGLDSAGVVVALGEGVTKFGLGDKVFYPGSSTSRQATFQQYTTVPAEAAAKIPPNLTFDQAASIPLGLDTAMHREICSEILTAHEGIGSNGVSVPILS